MEDLQILNYLELALNELFQKDIYLIENDLSEQSISHKLAEYLQKLFSNFNVDCEYNGNIEQPGRKKQIFVLKEQLLNIRPLSKKERLNSDEYVTRRVLPDIIVHKRGNNENNICIIEIKKSTYLKGQDFDFIKLQSYTSESYGNDLKYQIGFFIKFNTGINEQKDWNLRFFKNGYEGSFASGEFVATSKE